MDGLLKIQIAIDAKTFGISKWWLILSVAILAGVVGVLLIFRTSESARTLMIFLGISLLMDGIMNLITVLSTVKIIQNQYPDIITEEIVDDYVE